MVVDTSVLLAIFFEQAHARWAAEQLDKYRGQLMMSTVNLAETLIILSDRQPARFPELESRVLSGGLRFAAPDLQQARHAADARLRFPLNLGDCFAYALARVEGTGILTLDADFRSLDIPVHLP